MLINKQHMRKCEKNSNKLIYHFNSYINIKVMGTIASQLKALSKNTPQSSIILYLGVSPGSWVLSGREYHRQLLLFNPYSVLFQNLQLFFRMSSYYYGNVPYFLCSIFGKGTFDL